MPERMKSLAWPELSARLCIAVPTHNEHRYVRRVLSQLAHVPADVLFVDDHSTDGTRDILQAAEAAGEIHLLCHDTNLGYGKSLIDAFHWADARGYDWVITMDCDEQHDPANLPHFFEAIVRNEADIISGSRYAAPTRDDLQRDLPPPQRRVVNRLITSVINKAFGWKLTDTFCGFKAHRVGPTVAMDLDEFGYAFPMQLWPRAKANGLRIEEMPVSLIYNDPNRSFGNAPTGENLDDVGTRLTHYLQVMHRECCELNLPQPCPKSIGSMPLDIHPRLRQAAVDALCVPCA